MLETAVFIHLKHEGSHLGKLLLLLIDYSNHVHGFGGHVIESAEVNILEPHVDEVSKFLGVLEVAVVNQLHEEKVVEVQLGLWELHNLLNSSA